MQKTVSYSKAIARKYPEGVALAIVRDANGVDNPITLGWTMITSQKPPLLAMAVALTHHSRTLVEEAKEFVLAFPSADMAAECLYYGTHSGRDVNKFAERPLEVMPATQVNTILIKNAVANFECRLHSQLETGDHMLFVGEVVAAHMHEDLARPRLFTLKTGFVMGTAWEMEDKR